MNISRRRMLIATAGAFSLVTIPRWVAAQASRSLDEAVFASQLIYLSPIRSDGTESRCQSEIWYVEHGGDLYVVTDARAWRAQAVANGLDRARVWVGDLGNWKRTGGKYRQLPSMLTSASVATDRGLQGVVLGRFGEKYEREWPSWGPRFKKGLVDGDRVMLRYAL